MAVRQAALLFDEGAAATRSAQVRGGKGANLAEMVALGLPVPPGFTIPTAVCRAYQQTGRLPKRLNWHLHRGLLELEQRTGRQFGDPDNPLLVSVRSGAPVSMPGMMDTVLNVGLDPTNLTGLTQWGGKSFSRDTRDRFLTQFADLMGEVDDTRLTSPDWQLETAILAVLQSWNSERARSYRAAHGIPGWIGTAVNIQAMVFGNLDSQSCTGVVFSANVATGESGLYGEFLPRAQGEDVVSGVRTPLPIAQLAEQHPGLYQELEQYVQRAADHLGDIVELEFTVERGVLYTLQIRRAKLAPIARVIQVVHRVWGKQVTKAEAVASVPPSVVGQLRRPTFQVGAREQAAARIISHGLPASPGAAVGMAVFSADRARQLAHSGKSVILVRSETSPDDLPGMLVARGIVTAHGGKTCHAAVVARELGLPAVVGTGSLVPYYEGQTVSVDGTSGCVIAGELPLDEPDLPKEVNLFLKWVKAARQSQPRVNFATMEERYSVNRLLSDFYLSDLMAERSRGAQLEASAAELRNRLHQEIAECFAAYLFAAVSAELRHYWDHASHHRSSAAVNAAAQRVDRLTGLSHSVAVAGSGTYAQRKDAQRRTRQALEAAPVDDQVKFFKLAVTIFDYASWQGGSYGGRPWGRIAETLVNFLDGSLTSTLFVDHVFDLRHNGGRLFDKHPMVTRHTNEDNLRKQLDIKRQTSDPRVLHQQLNAIGPCSDRVDQLWKRGISLGLWWPS